MPFDKHTFVFLNTLINTHFPLKNTHLPFEKHSTCVCVWIASTCVCVCVCGSQHVCVHATTFSLTEGMSTHLQPQIKGECLTWPSSAGPRSPPGGFRSRVTLELSACDRHTKRVSTTTTTTTTTNNNNNNNNNNNTTTTTNNTNNNNNNNITSPSHQHHHTSTMTLTTTRPCARTHICLF